MRAGNMVTMQEGGGMREADGPDRENRSVTESGPIQELLELESQYQMMGIQLKEVRVSEQLLKELSSYARQTRLFGRHMSTADLKRAASEGSLTLLGVPIRMMEGQDNQIIASASPRLKGVPALRDVPCSIEQAWEIVRLEVGALKERYFDDAQALEAWVEQRIREVVDELSERVKIQMVEEAARQGAFTTRVEDRSLSFAGVVATSLVVASVTAVGLVLALT